MSGIGFGQTIGMLENALAGASATHAAIANNVANVNTPNYQRTDVSFKEALARSEDIGASPGGSEPPRLEAAEEEDWAGEYLSLTLAVGIVDSVDEAVEHIGRYSSGHSEAIVTRDTQAARSFQLGVDAACVYVNASTRFTDGGEFGMGAEIGNSTQKLHARGPIGLRELCTTKYLIEGDGHVRG